MIWLHCAWARVLGFFQRARLEEEMAEELRFHLAMRTRENIERGMPLPVANAQARRQLGNVVSIKEAWREVAWQGALATFGRDLRFAARMLKRDRALTITAVLALALGIGANIALFTVLSSVLLRPLPFPQPEQLMRVWSSDSHDSTARHKTSFPDFVDLQARNRTFDSLGAFVPSSFVIEHNNGEGKEVPAAAITSNIFMMLGARAELGRIFSHGDDEAGNRAVIISDQLWKTRFARAANVIGATLLVEGEHYQVVGVMPPNFRFPVQNIEAQLWITFGRDHEPLGASGDIYASHRDGHFLHLLGRLKAGRRSSEGEADLNAISNELATRYPESNAHFDACKVTPWLADLTSKVRPTLLMLIAAAACLLCVACANIANLLLARGAARAKEIAIRAALGAGRQRIARQLLTENFMLALVGGAVGLLFALIGTRLLVASLPADFPRAGEIAPDRGALAVAALVTLVTTCAFGFLPAWRSTRCDLPSALNNGSGAGEHRRMSARWRQGLVAAEIVISLVLLAGAGGLILKFWRMQNAPLGFDPHNVVTASVLIMDYGGAPEYPRALAFSEELLARLRGSSEIVTASATSRLPALGPESVVDFAIAGRDPPKRDWPRARPLVVASQYFRTMRIPFIAGRDFDARDTEQAVPVVIVNESLAREMFPRGDAIGQRIKPRISDDGGPPIEREIVGIVGDVKSQRAGDMSEQYDLYLPSSQCVPRAYWLLLRTENRKTMGRLFDLAHRITRTLDNETLIYEPGTLEDYVDTLLIQPRLSSAVLAAFALVAVALTAVASMA